MQVEVGSPELLDELLELLLELLDECSEELEEDEPIPKASQGEDISFQAQTLQHPNASLNPDVAKSYIVTSPASSIVVLPIYFQQ